MRYRPFILAIVFSILMLGIGNSNLPAQINPYSQDFESLDMSSPTALGGDGWLTFVNVFDDSGTLIYGDGPNPAPNGVGGFSNIATGQGGPDQGDQQLVIFSDYNNADHNDPDRVIESNVFQEFSIGAGDVGQTYRFTFDAKLGDIMPPSTALAFIKTIDPDNSFALTNFVTLDTTNLPVTWGTYSVELTIDSSLEGQLFQIGFLNTASEFTASGIVYDNVNLVSVPPSDPGLTEFFADFEGVDPVSCSAISDLGYFVFGNVFENGKFFGQYGPFVAPNSRSDCFEDAFSSISDVAVGQYSLNIFNDYQNESHFDPARLIQSNVYREQIVGADDVGTTWQYDFLFRRNVEDGMDLGPGGDATATAFIRILDQDNSFDLIDEFLLDTTAATEMFEPGSIVVEILPAYDGKVFQYGFANTASEFEPTGVLYDNVSFAPEAECILGDLNGDGMVTLLDVNPFVEALTAGDFVCEADVNEDGVVSLLDVDPFVSLLSGG